MGSKNTSNFAFFENISHLSPVQRSLWIVIQGSGRKYRNTVKKYKKYAQNTVKRVAEVTSQI